MCCVLPVDETSQDDNLPLTMPTNDSSNLQDVPAKASPGLPSRGFALKVFVGKASSLTATAASLASLVDLFVDREPGRGLWTFQITVTAIALFASTCAAIHRKKWWSDPTNKLLELSKAANEGDVPIEEISTVTGGIEPLVPLMKSLLREIRQRDRVIAELEFEMSQKVANRTDALERQLGSLKQQANRDALTGLLNRRALQVELPGLMTRTLRNAADMCVLMIDVDNFKPLNDKLGHAAGDQLLRQLGQLFRSTLRQQDQAFRLGGDEFVILLDGTNRDAGSVIAKRLETLVASMAVAYHVEFPPRLSIGVCALRDLEAPTAEALLATADQRLYAVKSLRPHVTRGKTRQGDKLAG